VSEQGIRNIIQTHQERPIIKMAPDMVIYIDGLPYLINDYIGDGGVIVNFNDFVTAASGAVDLDTFIPAASITLSIPVDLKSLFMAPGGNRIFKTMSEVKVFAKGYYLTEDGRSVYHRVFWGIISSVSSTDNRKTLEITLACKGILHLFDLMQTNLNASAMTAQATGSTISPLMTKESGNSPFEIILQTFLAPLKTDVIDYATVNEQNTTAQDRNVFERAYISKWAVHLKKLQRSVRLFGLRDTRLEKTDPPTKAAEGSTDAGIATQTQAGKSEHKQSESDRQTKFFDVDQISKYLPDFRVGQMQLLQSKTVSRLARIKDMVTAMGWEGYQDLDGSVIFKPPLFNLDTRLSDCDHLRNPFIINLAEIIGQDNEMEDESQVRLTRLEVCGTISGTPMAEANTIILGHTGFIDPGLVRQFGLRTEAPRQMELLADNAYVQFAYAVAELNKMNKRWRTYTCTIPFRPELRLGFPIFVPHLDIYAYLENISWNYNRGGSCTMNLSCTSVRWREMFGKQKEDPETKTKSWIYTAIPDLVFAWSKKKPSDATVNSQGRLTDPVGSAASQPADKSAKPSATQAVQSDREAILSKLMMVEADLPGASWRVENGAGGFFSTQKSVDKTYYDQVKKTMPYTDSGGYTLIRPFPWGRFIKLEKALDTFTRHPDQQTGKLLPFEGKDKGQNAQSSADVKTGGDVSPYLMAALGTPSLSKSDPTKGNDAATKILKEFKNIHDLITPEDADAIVCFTLSYDEAFDTTTLAKSSNEFNDKDLETAKNSVAPPKMDKPLPDADPTKKADDYVRGVTKNGQTWEGEGGFSQ
jgi:hypothetical protein